MRRSTLVAAVCWILLLVSAGQGQSSDRVGRARALFTQGVAYARAGQWELALVAFQSSFELHPRPAVLFNLASAQLRCGKLLASSANLRRFAASDEAAVTRTHRRSAQALIEQIESRIPKLRVQIDGLRNGDRVWLDKVRVYPEELGRDLWLDPGVHTLRVERPRADEEVRTFTVTEGQVRVLAFRLP